jgi:hypothetical protein
MDLHTQGEDALIPLLPARFVIQDIAMMYLGRMNLANEDP